MPCTRANGCYKVAAVHVPPTNLIAVGFQNCVNYLFVCCGMNVGWLAGMHQYVQQILRILIKWMYDSLLLHWPNWKWTSAAATNFTFHSHLCKCASRSHHLYAACWRMAEGFVSVRRAQRGALHSHPIGAKKSAGFFQWIFICVYLENGFYFRYFLSSTTFNIHRMHTIMMESQLQRIAPIYHPSKRKREIAATRISDDKLRTLASGATNWLIWFVRRQRQHENQIAQQQTQKFTLTELTDKQRTPRLSH